MRDQSAWHMCSRNVSLGCSWGVLGVSWCVASGCLGIFLPLVMGVHPPHHPVPHHGPPHPPHGGYCDPKAPPACALHTDVPFCLEDPDYPSYEIAEKISQDPIFLKKYSDIPDQSGNDLVEEITALQEATFDYNYYTGASKGPSPYDASHWIGPEGYLCPSQVDYVQIKR